MIEAAINPKTLTAATAAMLSGILAFMHIAMTQLWDLATTTHERCIAEHGTEKCNIQFIPMPRF